MGLEERATRPKTALSMLSTPGEGHFDPSEDKIEYLAFYLKKAAEYRLPPSDTKGPVKLRDNDPTHQGWLADRWHRDRGPMHPPHRWGPIAAIRTKHFGILMKSTHGSPRNTRPYIAGRNLNSSVCAKW